MNVSTLDSAKERLAALYREVSKHSAYQTIPDFVSRELGYQEAVQSLWRGDRNRLHYLLRKLSPEPGQHWGDFGANTGFFTYTLAHAFPQATFTAIEANGKHAEFLDEIRDLFGKQHVSVMHRAVAFDDLPTLSGFDVMLHLNVLHHAGADFDQQYVTGEHDFAVYAVDYLRRLRTVTRTLAFQIGSNLWGNKAHPLVEFTDDINKVLYVSRLITDAGWKIRHLAYPKAPLDADVVYDDVDPAFVALLNTPDARPDPETVAAALAPFELDRHIGEFYRRGFYILE